MSSIIRQWKFNDIHPLMYNSYLHEYMQHSRILIILISTLCTTTILEISRRNRINSQVKSNDSFTLQVTQFQAHKIRCNNSCMLCTIQISSSQLKTNPRRISDGMFECRILHKTWSIYPLYTNKENGEFEIISQKCY